MSHAKIQEHFKWITPALLTILTSTIVWAASKINSIPIIEERQSIVYSKYVPLIDKHEVQIEVIKANLESINGTLKRIERKL